MEKLIYKANLTFIPDSFTLGHSVLRIKGLENDVVITFQGTFYMEMPRMFNGIEIWRLGEDEQNELLQRRPELTIKGLPCWKIVSNDTAYYFVAFGVEVE